MFSKAHGRFVEAYRRFREAWQVLSNGPMGQGAGALTEVLHSLVTLLSSASPCRGLARKSQLQCRLSFIEQASLRHLRAIVLAFPHAALEVLALCCACVRSSVLHLYVSRSSVLA